MFSADFWWVSVIAAAVFVAFLAIVVIVLKRRNVKGETKDRFYPEERKINFILCLCSHQNEQQQCKFVSILLYYNNSSVSAYELLVNHHDFDFSNITTLLQRWTAATYSTPEMGPEMVSSYLHTSVRLCDCLNSGVCIKHTSKFFWI